MQSLPSVQRRALFSSSFTPVRRLLGALLSFLWISPTASSQDLTKGADIYATYCSACHGANLEGGQFSGFLDGVWHHGSDQIYQIQNIKNGIPDTEIRRSLHDPAPMVPNSRPHPSRPRQPAQPKRSSTQNPVCVLSCQSDCSPKPAQTPENTDEI